MGMGDDAPSPSLSPSSSGGSRSPSTPRTKRRRTDRYVLGFEFAPRLAPYELQSSPEAPAQSSPEAERILSPEAPPPHAAPEWTEGSSFALLDAWGHRFVRSGRRGIRTSSPETKRIPSPEAPPPRAAARDDRFVRSSHRSIRASSPETERIPSPEAPPPRTSPGWREGSSFALHGARGDRFLRSSRRGIRASPHETERIPSPEAPAPHTSPKYTEGTSFAPRDAPGDHLVRSSRRSIRMSSPEIERIPSPEAPPPRTAPEWTEASSFALLDAWGNRFVRSGCRGICAEEWLEIARLTSAAVGHPAGYYSESQCRNRIDTLRKKLKIERGKMRVAARHSLPTSKWVYFDRLMSILYPPPPRPSTTTDHSDSQPSSSPLPLLLPYVVTRQRDRIPARLTRLPWGGGAPERMLGGDGDTGGPRDSWMDAESGEEQKFEAAQQNRNGFAVSTKPIQMFGGVAERLESRWRQHMVEVDQMMKDFHRDLDARWRDILEKAQAEIACLEDTDGDGGEGDEEDGDDGDGNKRLEYVSDQEKNNGNMDASHRTYFIK